MKVAIYPGSFNPMHQGHLNVVKEGLKVFDKVIVAVGVNPTKPPKDLQDVLFKVKQQLCSEPMGGEFAVVHFEGLLVDYISENNQRGYNIHAVLKGVRNASDLEDERVQLYHNQDLGIAVPTYYILANRDVLHISSTAIRTIATMRKK